MAPLSRSAAALVALWLVWLPAGAQQATQDLLEAPIVHRYVRLQIVDGKPSTLEYRSDSTDDSFQPLAKDTVLAAKGPVSIRIADFNPLVWTIAVEVKTEEDPNYSSLSKFLDVVKSAAGELGIKGGGGEIKAQAFSCAGIKDLSKRVDDKLGGLATIPARVPNWVRDARGLEAIQTLLNPNTKDGPVRASADLTKHIAELQVLATEVAIAKTSAGSAKCDEVTLLRLEATATRLADDIANKKQLKADIDEIGATLQQYAAKHTKWKNGSSAHMDYEVATVDPQFQKLTPTVTLTRQSYAVTTDGRIARTASAATSYSFVIRQHAVVVPEVAAALLYNEVRYPLYGTEETGGRTVVALSNKGKGRVDGALMLNMVCRCWGPAPFYPMLQLGVSTAKDFPGFLAGIGFRFTRPRAVSLSVGRMVTWFKDLDKLKIGDPVTGTAQLDADLKLRRAPGAWYGAVQYSFK